MAGVMYHILGSGMPENNPIMQARLQPVLDSQSYHDRAILYGRQQPHLPVSEAASYVAYLEPLVRQGAPELIPDDRPKSVSETMALVARRVRDDFQAWCAKDVAYGPDGRAYMRPHRVVINWPYMWRTRYLLRRQWARMYPDVPWAAVRNMVAFQSVGGTFVPYLKRNPLKALIWWPVFVALQEVLRCGKALVDPYDRRFNQQRQWSGWFRKVTRTS